MKFLKKALPMCLLAEIIAFGRSYWKPRFAARKAKTAMPAEEETL